MAFDQPTWNKHRRDVAPPDWNDLVVGVEEDFSRFGEDITRLFQGMEDEERTNQIRQLRQEIQNERKQSNDSFLSIPDHYTDQIIVTDDSEAASFFAGHIIDKEKGLNELLAERQRLIEQTPGEKAIEQHKIIEEYPFRRN